MPNEPIDFSKLARPAQPVMRTGFDARITGRYDDPRDGGARRHHALDLGYGEGDPIAVNKRGRVVSRGEDEKSGKYLFIDHGDGDVSSYSHLQGWDAEDGEEIEPGRAFARAGHTATKSPHLHFVVRRNGQRINPEETDIRPMRATGAAAARPAGIDFSQLARPAQSQEDSVPQAGGPPAVSPDPQQPSNTPQPAGATTTTGQGAGGPESTRPLPTTQYPRLEQPGFGEALAELQKRYGPATDPETLKGYVEHLTKASQFGDLSDPKFRAAVVEGNYPVPAGKHPSLWGKVPATADEQEEAAATGAADKFNESVSREHAAAVEAQRERVAKARRRAAAARHELVQARTAARSGGSSPDKSYALGESPEEKRAAAFRFNEREPDEFTSNFNAYRSQHPANVGRDAVRALEQRLADATAAHREERGKLMALRRPGNLDRRRESEGRQAEEMAAAVQFKPGPAYDPSADEEARLSAEARTRAEREVDAEQDQAARLGNRGPGGYFTPEERERKVSERAAQYAEAAVTSSRVLRSVGDRPVDEAALRSQVEDQVRSQLRSAAASGVGFGVGSDLDPESYVRGQVEGRVRGVKEADAYARELQASGRELGAFDWWQDLKSRPLQLAPFAGTIGDVVSLLRLGDAGRRFHEGKETEEDRQRLRSYATLAGRDQTSANKILSIVSQFPAFAGEMALTEGAYRAPKEAVEAGLKRALSREGRSLLERSAAEGLATRGAKAGAELAVRGTGSTVGGLVQTIPAGSLRIAEGFIRRTQGGEDPSSALWTSAIDQFIETWSEHTGGVTEYGPKFKRLERLRAIGQRLSKPLKRAGYDGTVGEMLEERFGEVAKWAAGVQPDLTVMGVPVRDYAEAKGWKEAGRQLLVEFVGFSVPGVANAGRYGFPKAPGAGADADSVDAPGGGPVAAPFVNKPAPGSQTPVPESAETLAAQFKSAADANSPRAGVLITPGEKVPSKAPPGFIAVDMADGNTLFLNETKLSAAGLDTDEKVIDHIEEHGFEALIGKVAPVADTSQGQALRTEDAAGRELSTSIVPSAEAAEAQAQVDLEQFPEAANQEVMPAQEAAALRQEESNGEQTQAAPVQPGAGQAAPADASARGDDVGARPRQPRGDDHGGEGQLPSGGEVNEGATRGGAAHNLDFKGAMSDLGLAESFGRDTWERLGKGKKVLFSERPGSLESYVQREYEAGRVKGADDITAIYKNWPQISSAGEAAADNPSTAGEKRQIASQAVEGEGARAPEPKIDFSGVARPAAGSNGRKEGHENAAPKTKATQKENAPAESTDTPVALGHQAGAGAADVGDGPASDTPRALAEHSVSGRPEAADEEGGAQPQAPRAGTGGGVEAVGRTRVRRGIEIKPRVGVARNGASDEGEKEAKGLNAETEAAANRDGQVRQAGGAGADKEDAGAGAEGERGHYVHSREGRKAKWEKVEGRDINIWGFGNHDIFVHKSVDGSDKYTVTEGTTGQSIAEGDTEAEAIAAATEKLNGYARLNGGTKAFDQTVAGSRKAVEEKIGKSPRHGGAVAEEKKAGSREFDITVAGEKVRVTYAPKSMGGKDAPHDHFEFRGAAVSETGYKSHFVPSSAVKYPTRVALDLAERFHAELPAKTRGEKSAAEGARPEAKAEKPGTSPPAAAERTASAVAPAKEQKGGPEKQTAKLLERLGLQAKIFEGEDFSVHVVNRPYLDLSIERHTSGRFPQIYLTHYIKMGGDLVMDTEAVYLVGPGGHLKLAEVASRGPAGEFRTGTGTGRKVDRGFAGIFASNLVKQGFDKGELVYPEKEEGEGQNVLSGDGYDEIRRAVESADADAAPTFRPFPEGMGDTSIPRASMPQVKSIHRGAMVQFLIGRGIRHTQEEVRADSLRPSQAEYSPEKVKKAQGFEGPDRSLIISGDGHVADGHHQWLAKVTDEPGQLIPVIRFDAPIQQLLVEMARFPSSGVDEASSKATTPPVDTVSTGRVSDEEIAERIRKRMLARQAKAAAPKAEPEAVGEPMSGGEVLRGVKERADDAEAKMKAEAAAPPVNAEREKIFERLRALQAKKSSGGPLQMAHGEAPDALPSAEELTLMVSLARTYIDEGVRKFADAARRFLADYGPGAHDFGDAFEIGWEEIRDADGADVDEPGKWADAVRGVGIDTGAEGEENSDHDSSRSPSLEGEGARDGRPPRSVGQGGGSAPAGDQSQTPPRTGARGGSQELPDSDAGEREDEVRPAGGAGHEAADGARTGEEGVSDAGRDGVKKPRAPKDPARKTPALSGNYRITDPDAHGVFTQVQKYNHNLTAILLVKQLEEEGRPPTAEEQDKLARWTGWGSLPQVFNPFDWGSEAAQYYEDNNARQSWQKRQKELRALLTPEEYEAARKSTLNAHYTSGQVVSHMWSMVRRLGFTGGRILEPAVGSGNFFGLMPDDFKGAGTQLFGIDLDRITAKVAQHLYPAAKIERAGFEEVPLPDNFFDLVISNFPFGDYKVYDKVEKERNQFNANIHDYFFLKALDKVRPGGLVVAVTSTYTMDKLNPKIRKAMAERAELVAAIRLPEGVFGANAGTQVVTDIVILKRRVPASMRADRARLDMKDVAARLAAARMVLPDAQRAFDAADPKKNRDEKTLLEYTETEIRTLEERLADLEAKLKTAVETDEPADDLSWIEAEPALDETGAQLKNQKGELVGINHYFNEHPEQLLGILDTKSRLYGKGALHLTATDDFPERFLKAVERITAGLYEEAIDTGEEFQPEILPAPGEVKVGGYTFKGTKLFQREGGALVEQKRDQREVEIVKGTLAVRDALRALLQAEETGLPTKVGAARQELNKQYDQFHKKHGAFHKSTNARAFADDPDSPNMLALEEWNPQTKKATKGPVFTQSVTRRYERPRTAPNQSKALGISLNEYGRVSVKRIAELLSVTEAQAESDLLGAGLIFRDPTSGLVQRDLYLSGNVRKKLLEAKQAAKVDPFFESNVSALEGVQPEDIEPEDIEVQLGASWVTTADMQEFLASLVSGKPDHFNVTYTPAAGWFVAYTRDGERLHRKGNADVELWGTKDAPLMEVVNAALTRRPIIIKRSSGSGDTKVTWVDQKATDDANAKVTAAREQFAEWVWDGEERRVRLHRFYNDTFNNEVPFQPDGSHLDFPGMVKEMNGKPFGLRPHQVNAVWRTITSGRALYAHEVGTGKTYTMAAAAMELKRLGLAKKPAIVVPKSRIDATVREIQELYPNARLLSTGSNFDAKLRKRTIARMSLGDYDIIILTHKNVDMLRMKPETEETFIREELAELESVISAVMSNGDMDERAQTKLVKQLEKKRIRLLGSITKALNDAKRDDTVYFEDTGIDALFVDEAHFYKALPVYTTMDRVKGIPNRRSQRATNMFMRVRWLQQRNNNRGIVFATGTPIANTMVEFYNMQKYLQWDALFSRGIHTFDAWAMNFGVVTNKVETRVTGEEKATTRFSEFTNIPELTQISREVMDVKFAWEMPDIVRPEKKVVPVGIEMTDAQKLYMAEIVRRAGRLKGPAVKGGDNMLKISSDARKASLDMRLVFEGMPDDPDSKLNQAVRNILKVYRTHPGTTQMLFSDIGINPTKKKKADPEDEGAEDEAKEKDEITELGEEEADDSDFEVKTGFSLFNDIIAKLVAGGIPRDKIINFSGLTDAQRPLASERLRSGDAVVGLGSTASLGTGVNAQDHLRALHHLDAPWLPADVEQRDGRGWRQGNQNKELSIYRYVTLKSFDKFMWELLDRKTHFIKQAMKGDLKVRKIKEEDTEEIDAGMMAAITSGNPYAMERRNLTQEVTELEKSAARHKRQQTTLQSTLRDNRKEVERLTKAIGAVEADAAKVAASKEAEFKLTVGGIGYETRKDGGTALRARVRSLVEQSVRSYRPEEAVIGELRGFKLKARAVGTMGASIYIEGGLSYEVQLTTEQIMSEGADGGLKSVEGVMNNLHRRANPLRDKLEQLRKNIEATEATLGKPFKGTEKLKQQQERLLEVTKLYNQEAGIGGIVAEWLKAKQDGKDPDFWLGTIEEYAEYLTQTGGAEINPWDKGAQASHTAAVEKAVKDGLPVPPNVREQVESKYAGVKQALDADQEASVAGLIDSAQNPNDYYSYNAKTEKFERTDARPVLIDGFEDVDLFVHKPIEGSGGWHVTEGTSGARVADGNTRDEAVSSAGENLRRVGKEKLLEHIAAAVEKHGRSPRNPQKKGGGAPLQMSSARAEAVTDSPAFRRWFGDSKVIDENGEPLVVHHASLSKFDVFDESQRGSNTGAPSAREGFFFASSPVVAASYGSDELRHGKEAWERKAAFEAERDEMAKAEGVKPMRLLMLYATGRLDNHPRIAEFDRVFQGINDAESLINDLSDPYFRSEAKVSESGNLYSVHLSLQNPLVHDQKGERFRDERFSELIKRAKAEGRDGVIIRNTYDSALEQNDEETDVYIAFRPEQIKSVENRGTFDPSDPNILNMASAGGKDLEALADEEFSAIVPRATVTRDGHLLEVNAEGHEILRRAFEQNLIDRGEREGPAVRPFDGTFLTPEEVKATVRTLKAAAKQLEEFGYDKADSRALDEMAGQLVAAAREGQGTAIAYLYDHAVPHEEFHRAGFVGALSEALASRHARFDDLAAHPAVQKAWETYFNRVDGYSRLDEAVLVEETAAWIAGGHAATLGLSDQEAAEYLDLWFESYAEKNGDESLEHFVEVTLPHVRQVIEQVRARRPDAGRGQAGSEGRGRGVPQTPQPAEGAEGEGRTGGAEGGAQGPRGQVKPRALPATLRALGLEAADELYEVYPNKAANRDAREIFERLGFEGSVQLLETVGEMGPQHSQLSKILQRALLKEAARVSVEDSAQAAELRRQAQKIGSQLAARMTGAGQFVQSADTADTSVEDVMATAAAVARDRGFELSDREAERVHAAGEELERTTAELEVVAAQVAEMRRERERLMTWTVKAREGGITLGELSDLKKKLARLREKEKRREDRIGELDGLLPERKRKERARGVRSSARQRAVEMLSADEEDLAAELRGLLGAGPLMMAQADPAAGGPRGAGAPPALDPATFDKLARLGALRLLKAERGALSVQQFKQGLIDDFGPRVRPEVDRIHAAAVKLMRRTMREANAARELERIAARDGNEGLTREQLQEIALRERGARRRASLVAAEHQKAAKATEKAESAAAFDGKPKSLVARGMDVAYRTADVVFGDAEEYVKGVAKRAASKYLKDLGRTVGGEVVRTRVLADAIARHAASDVEAVSAAKQSLADMTPRRFGREMAAEHGLRGQALRDAWKAGGRVLDAARAEVAAARDEAAALKADARLAGAGLDQAVAALRGVREDRQRARQAVANELHRVRDGRAVYAAKQVWEASKGVPISLMASGDVSGIFNQGGVAVWMHPTLLPGLAKATVGSWSKTHFAGVIDAIEHDADFATMQRMKISFAFAGDEQDNTSGEEMFKGGDILTRVPVLKQTAGLLVTKSDESFGGGLDWMRAALAKMIITELRAKGVSYRENKRTYERMGAYVNIITGRGDIGPHNTKLTKALMGVMKLIGFAPRYRMSRLQFLSLPLNRSFWRGVHPAARRIILKDLASYYGKVGGLMLLLTALGVAGLIAFSWDPDDDDFLKLKIGKLRLDLTGGNQSQARFVAKLLLEGWRGMSGQITGPMAVEGTGEGLLRWLRSGADPRFSLALDWALGEDFTGKPFRWGGLDGAVASRLTPMSWNQALKTAREEGGGYAAAQLPLDATGLRASVYPDRPNEPKTTAERLAVRYASREFRNSKPIDEQTKRLLDELKERARAGADVRKELAPLVEAETITQRRADSIANAKGQTLLQEKIRVLKPEDALHVLKYATPAERESVKQILRDKQLNKAAKDDRDEKARENPEREEMRRRKAGHSREKQKRKRELRYGEQVDAQQ